MGRGKFCPSPQLTQCKRMFKKGQAVIRYITNTAKYCSHDAKQITINVKTKNNNRHNASAGKVLTIASGGPKNILETAIDKTNGG
jgi:hypothetical protein